MQWSWETRAVEYLQRLGGKARPLKHYRCGACRARRSLRRELWQYLRPPRCRECSAVDWRLDLSRYREWQHRTGVFDTCYCGELHHPHRIGGSVWCLHHPTGPGPHDFRGCENK
jgi:hypothetical protein